MSVALGFVEWTTLFLQELIHGPLNLQGAPAVVQEMPPVCVTDCKRLYDHLSAVGSTSTLQSERSAIDVLIIREPLRKTGCVIRWAPTGRLLADGLTKDKGEAVECLRRSLRSGASHPGEAPDESEQADSDREESNSGTVPIGVMVGQSWLDCCVALSRGYGCRYFLC